MTVEQIEKFLSEKVKAGSLIRISFKTRTTISGIFITTADSNELKSKNFWRIVSADKFEQWEKSQDANLSRMYNGAIFAKLAVA